MDRLPTHVSSVSLVEWRSESWRNRSKVMTCGVRSMGFQPKRRRLPHRRLCEALAFLQHIDYSSSNILQLCISGTGQPRISTVGRSNSCLSCLYQPPQTRGTHSWRIWGAIESTMATGEVNYGATRAGIFEAWRSKKRNGGACFSQDIWDDCLTVLPSSFYVVELRVGIVIWYKSTKNVTSMLHKPKINRLLEIYLMEWPSFNWWNSKFSAWPHVICAHLRDPYTNKIMHIDRLSPTFTRAQP